MQKKIASIVTELKFIEILPKAMPHRMFTAAIIGIICKIQPAPSIRQCQYKKTGRRQN